MKDKMSDETKYELNVYCRQLNKDLTNLMDCLRKQDKDNKAILYEGRHLKKVILPYEEYQKMCQRLESIDNANPSEALRELENLGTHGIEYREPFELGFTKSMPFKSTKEFKIIKQALIKAQEQEKVLSIIKEKNVDFDTLTDSEALDDYNSKMNWSYRRLTEEEFNTLKEWSKL